MNKKIMIGLSLVLIAIMAAGSVSAFDFNSLLGQGGDESSVTVGGVEFTIPEGFVEDPNQELINEQKEASGISYTVNSKLYEKGDTVVVLLVSDYGEYKVTDEIAASTGGEPKTINNINGYLSTNDTFKVFNYAKDDKLVVISTNNENVIGDFIIE